MDRKRLIVLGIALVAACCAALLVRGMLGGGTPKVQAKTAPEIAMSEVLVASANLTPGQAVTTDQVRWEKWPTTAVDSSFITHGAVGSVEEVIKGTVVRSPVLAGQPLVSTTLVHADASGFMAAMLTEGMRAVSITVSAETGAGGFILPNDRIDVIQSRKINDNVFSKTILANVRVLAVDQTFHQEKDAKTVIGKTATLEVTPDQAELLYNAQTGGTLSLSLRPLGDNQLVASAAPRKKNASNFDGPVSVIRYGVKAGVPAQQEKTPVIASRNIFFLSLGLAFAALTAPAMARPALDESSARTLNISTRSGGGAHQRITLSVDKAAVVQLDSDARDVLVSNPDMVDAVVRTPRRIFLLATKVGQTNAFFFDGEGKQILSLDIRVEKDVVDLAGLMRTSLPNSSIAVQSMNDNVVLTGTVSSALESTRAADLAARFAGDPKKVVNMLSVAGGAQVMLKVRIAEMDRNIAKQFGVDLTAAGKVGGVPLSVSTSNPYGLLGRALSDLSGGQAGSTCGVSQFIPAVTTATNTVNGITSTTTSSNNTVCPNNAQGVLKALEQVGLVHMLAEPNLTAVSGETARFLAGGEFPVPAGRDQQGNVSIQFKQFGVGLSFTPVVLSPGRISLQLSSEVSELTNTGSFTLQGGNGVAGVTIPALSVRRAQTTVELPSGGSFAVAGLMQHNTKQVVDGFPGVKDLPVLGALFRSRDFADDQTELVVLISAYLVEPNSESAFAAPTDGFVAPSDPETLLLGRLNAVYKKKPDDKPLTSQAAAPVGFVVR